MDNTDQILGCLKQQNIFVLQDEPMKNHTTFKIGGNAKLLINVKSVSELKQVLNCCKKYNTEFFILGNGSNLLVSDKGLNKVVIALDGDFKKIDILDDTTIYCGSGVTLAKLCNKALSMNLSGLEFAWGIPGSAGGAAFMNAGAYGGEMKDVLYSCTHITPDGEIGVIKASELELAYRSSVYKHNGYIITGITVKLNKSSQDDIRIKMDDFLSRRKSKQPLEFPSAGSVFKRPHGNYAGTLIEQCGLKGTSVGGAQVSTKHAGFIINTGGATCSDVCNLIELIQKTVYEKTGYNLEREIILLGD